MSICVHFVGFTEEQRRRWRCVFGKPEYVHDKWDVRAEQEYQPGDVVVYANKTPRRAEERDFFINLSRD